MNTVHELKVYLEKNRTSPEEVAIKVNISNMTLRRLLKKPAQTKIPGKYRVQLGQLAMKDQALDINKINDVIDYLNESGEKITPDKVDKLKVDLDEKLKTASVDQSFKDKLKLLTQVALSGKNRKSQVVAIGALLYFINPFDLIPDYLPLGYIDDIGVITVALGAILKMKSNSDESVLLGTAEQTAITSALNH